jgi:hypothetical protein
LAICGIIRTRMDAGGINFYVRMRMVME